MGENLRAIRSMSAFGVSELHVITEAVGLHEKAYHDKGAKFGCRYVVVRTLPRLADSMKDLTARGYSTVLCCSSNSTPAPQSVFESNIGTLPRIALIFGE